jgi:hypothetical protein
MPATPATELINEVAGLVVVLSGVLAGVTRSLAILRRSTTEAVDRATAVGFLAGAVFAVVILVASLLWR